MQRDITGESRHRGQVPRIAFSTLGVLHRCQTRRTHERILGHLHDPSRSTASRRTAGERRAPARDASGYFAYRMGFGFVGWVRSQS